MIGVLALQGDWAAHGEALEQQGRTWTPVRTPEDLARVDGLVLPGGESTTLLRLLDHFDLARDLDAKIRGGMPTLATCAGVVLAARTVTGPAQPGFGWLDIDVVRNGWGRQRHSFVDRGRLFIRAPRITRVGPACEVLDTVRGEPALVRQGAVVGATFHPELVGDTSVARLAFGPCPVERSAGVRTSSPGL